MSQDGPFRVRGDAFFVRTPDGATVYHGTGSLTIAHPRAYDLLALLASRLDGGSSAAQVLTGLPEGARAAAASVLESLRRHGFLVPAGPPVGPRPDWVAERFGEHLDYLAQFPGDPYARFTAARARSVAVVGAGPLLRAAAGALADHAFTRVRLVTGDAAAVTDVLDAVADRDPEAQWAVGPDVDTDAVVYAGVEPADGPVRFGAVPLGVLHASRDRVVGAVVLGSDGCWECVRRTLGVDGPSSDPVPRPAASLAAFQVVHRLYREFACPAEARDRTAVTVLTDTLTSARHTVWRHPLCPRHDRPAPLFAAPTDEVEEAAPVRPVVTPDEDAPNAEAGRITAAIRSWTDPVAGPLLAVGEEDLPQLPLAASRCRTAAGVVTRTGPWAREARTQAVLGAMADLGAAVLAARGVGGHVGAGWSAPEAFYRALLALSADLSPGPEVPGTAAVERLRSPLTAFLLDTIGRDVTTASTVLPTGLHRVTAWHAGSPIGVGLGSTADHAEDNALLAAASGDTAKDTAPVHIAPPVKTWSEALRASRLRSSAEFAIWDLTAELPFIGEHAAVVAIQASAGTR